MSPASQINAFLRTALLVFLFCAVVACQWGYDVTKSNLSASLPNSFSPGFIRVADLGFNPAAASFMWAGTMPEILDIFNGKTEYLSDLSFMNTVDPKFGYPYAFSVLTLPIIVKFPDAMKDAMAIGQEGLRNADPDWRIPYYMATNYFVSLKDPTEALLYYDIAARTPGIPDYAQRFAENFGSGASERAKTEELWTTIRDSTNDPATKARSQAYIDRLEIFDYLEAASKAYRQKYGAYPASLDQLVQKKVIPQIPQDPFGYTFLLNKDGTVGIDLSKPPVNLQ
jgi:hypothetical protein